MEKIAAKTLLAGLTPAERIDPAQEIGQGRGRRARLRIAAHATEKTQAVRRRPATILGRVTALGHVYKIPD